MQVKNNVPDAKLNASSRMVINDKSNNIAARVVITSLCPRAVQRG
ncbi:MAG: hypothetical protein AAGA27_08595 [Pseudomonadota bacterium]